MHYSLLKKLSLAMCSLVMTLCSEVQSTQPDIEFELSELQGTRLVAQTEADLTSTQTIELKKPSTSWASSLLTPLKAVSDIISYAAQNPTKTAMISLVLVANITAVAATCDCVCIVRFHEFVHSHPIGMIENEFSCSRICLGPLEAIGSKCR
ncbi:MAG: hypothetical protein KF798_02480 [Candidatus Paracaedibacteraceae bacterium]|nr:hypothetical protein [Candidatus Paracaedibacteraceae bacterium]